MQVVTLPGAKLDPCRWDAFVSESPQGRIYGKTAVWNTICPNWKACILLDSTGQWLAALPIHPQRKLGIVPYLYPPRFVQQQGPYLAQGVGTDAIHLLLDALPASLDTLIKISPDFSLSINQLPPYWAVTARTNQVILPNDAPSQFPQYRHGHREMLKKVSRSGLSVRRVGESDGQLIPWHSPMHLPANGWVRRELERLVGSAVGVQEFEAICKVLELQGDLLELHVHNAANEWEAFGVYWQDDKRIYSMAIVRNPATPRTPGVVAMHHHMMKRAVQTNKVFDFEGSDLPGVHDFNAGFGATDETYWEIRRTHPLLRRRKP